jgi:predicted anti-sigma-YlaC factor YlaD
MKCRYIEPLLSNHLEGRLSQRDARVVATHLHDCLSCRRLRDDMVAAEADLRAQADPLPPPDLERRAVGMWLARQAAPSRIRGRGFIIPAARAPLARWSPWHTAVLVAALLLALLGLELPAAGGVAPGLHPLRQTVFTPDQGGEWHLSHENV